MVSPAARLWRPAGRRPPVKYGPLRYSEIAGFIGIVNWGQDDAWEIGTRYRAEAMGFRVAAAITYGENTEVRRERIICFRVSGRNPRGSYRCKL